MNFKKTFRYFDYLLFVTTLVIFILGLFVLYSAAYQKSIILDKNFTMVQIMWMGVSLAVLLLILCVNYIQILNASYIIYAVNICMLLGVLILGRTFYGAQRWLTIFGFTFQPSEVAKITTILTLAYYMGGRARKKYKLIELVIPFAIVAVPMLLIIKQPDLGTSLIFLPVFLSMLFVWGIKWRHLLSMFFVGIATTPLLWFVLKDYQKKRLLVFLNPNIDPLGAGYTITQSKIAIGSGGLFGKGWLAGTQNQLNFLPERHTDFIFSVVGEEWGFIGSIMLLILFYIIIKRGLYIIDKTNNLSGRLMATGIVTMLACQIVINIGMTAGFMPVVGLPLPIISYGGSSMISTMIAIGLLLNISMRRSVF